MAAHLFVTCRCGKQIPVTSGMAGSFVDCECGETNSVPTLRHLSGTSQDTGSADGTDPLALIRRYLQHGQPPAGPMCILCQGTTENSIRCELDGWQSGLEDPSSLWIVRWLRRVLGRAPRSPSVLDSPSAESSREPLPITVRLCAACLRRAGDLDHPATLRKILERSALYRQLYSSYPYARFRFVKS